MFVPDGAAIALDDDDDDDIVMVESTNLALVGKLKVVVDENAECPVCASRVDCERADVVMDGVTVAAVVMPPYPSSVSIIISEACLCVSNPPCRGNSAVSGGGLGSGGPCCGCGG